MQKYILSLALAVLLLLMSSSMVDAQTATVDPATGAELGTALNVLDGALDATAARDAQGTISNEAAVEGTLENIENTLLQIQAELGTGTAGNSGEATIPSGFPNTGHHPDM